MSITTLGWSSFFEEHFQHFKEKGLFSGRVLQKNNEQYTIHAGEGCFKGKLSGKFRYHSHLSMDLPAVGDWVVFEAKENCDFISIQAVLPRKSYFSRKQPISGGRKIKKGVIVGGSTEEQVIAANIDTVFIVTGLDGDFDIRRLERYLTLSYRSGATPIIVLNKSDLCTRIDNYKEQVNQISLHVPILVVSAEKKINMDSFTPYLKAGSTIALLGSSGVGKSTITNYLLGQEKQKKQTTSLSTGKGKHTTTSAELLITQEAYMLIDTPGLREVQLWGDKEVLKKSFNDVTSLIARCKFSNCRHQTEPGCAIKMAIDEGTISKKRFESFQIQFDELYNLELKKKKIDIQRNRIMKQKKLKG